MPRFGPRSTASTRPKPPAPKPPAVKAHGGGGGLATAPRPRGTPAQGGAVLRRGTFQPDNRKQQAELKQGVRQNATEQHRQRAHSKVLLLLSQGKTREAGRFARAA